MLNPRKSNPWSRWTIRVLASLKARPLGSSHSASRALTCSACARDAHRTRQVIGVPHQDRRAGSGAQGAALPVPDPGGLFHAVQCHVHERGADHPALGSSLPGRGEPAVLDHARPEPLAHQFPGGEGAQRGEDVIMAEPVECRLQVGVEHPQPAGVLAGCRGVDGHDRVMAAAAGPESVGPRLEPGLPLGLQRVQRQGLKRPVGDHGNPEPATAPVALRHIHPPDGQGPPPAAPRCSQAASSAFSRLPARSAVDPGRPAASVDLRHPPHAHQSVAAGAEHQLLQVADLSQVPGLRCREDPPSQTPYVLFDLAPVHSVPVEAIVLRSVHQIGVQLVPRFGVLPSSLRRLTRPASALFRAGQQPYPASYAGTAGGGASTRFPVSCCLSATGIRFSGLPAPAAEFSLPHGRPTGRYPAGPHRGCHVPHAIDTTGVGVL